MAATAAAIGAAPLVGPASAHDQGAYSTTFADGGGSLSDDFGDHYSEIGNSLCYGCGNSWNTDTVVMWQAFLAAEGLLSHSAIDGRFGPGTRDATKKFQSRYGLTADGKVGPATWDKADNRLRWDSCGCYVRYDGYGSTGSVNLTRGNPWAGYDSGAYELSSLRDDDGAHHTYFNDSHHIYHKSRTVTVDNWK
ncbi:MAG: peptidoglycan-binding domain-containing protein [Micromonosporaceae bacterium]